MDCLLLAVTYLADLRKAKHANDSTDSTENCSKKPEYELFPLGSSTTFSNKEHVCKLQLTSTDWGTSHQKCMELLSRSGQRLHGVNAIGAWTDPQSAAWPNSGGNPQLHQLPTLGGRLPFNRLNCLPAYGWLSG